MCELYLYPDEGDLADQSLSVIGAILVQLVLLGRLLESEDITIAIWSYQLVTQFVINLSVITVCIPYMRSALMGIESGMFQTGNFHLRRLGAGKPPQETQHPSEGSGGSAVVAPKISELNQINEDGLIYTGSNLGMADALGERNTIVKATTPDEHWDDQSQSSHTRIIKTTREWTIDYNNGGDPLSADYKAIALCLDPSKCLTRFSTALEGAHFRPSH